MSKFNLLDRLVDKNKGYIRTSEARENGISRSYFLEYIEERGLSRVAHGLYMTEDTWEDDFFVLQTRYPHAIFSHENAAYFLGLSEREPFAITLTLATGKSSSRLNKEGIKVYKIKEDLFELGLIEILTPYGNKVRTYNLERTFCDMVRSRANIEVQDYQAYIQGYLRHKEKNIPKLMRYAKLFSVDSIIKDYLEVLSW